MAILGNSWPGLITDIEYTGFAEDIRPTTRGVFSCTFRHIKKKDFAFINKMAPRTTEKDIFGPGTFVDTAYNPLPAECRRLLHHFANMTPGFVTDATVLDDVDFHGDDLPIIPGPLKAQALVNIAYTMLPYYTLLKIPSPLSAMP